MQYKIIDHRWQKLQIDEHIIRTHGYDLENVMEIEHNENLDLFEKLIQESIAEGWTPLGAPIFTEGSYKMDCRRMYQALTKPDEKEVSVVHSTSDESTTITSGSTVFPKLVPHPPSRRRVNSSSNTNSNINMKSPRMTRSERLRQEYLKLHSSGK
jgi:hypothetical protein